MAWLAVLLIFSGLSAIGWFAFSRWPRGSEKLASADRLSDGAPTKQASVVRPATPPPKKPVVKQPTPKPPPPVVDSDRSEKKPTEPAEPLEPIVNPTPADSKPVPSALVQEPDGPKEDLGLVGEKPPVKLGVPADKPTEKGLAGDPPLGIAADPPLAIYAARTQPKTPQWLAERGGTPESQAAVEDGLNWLARHQTEDGHWGADCIGPAQDSCCEKTHPCDGPGEAFEAAHTGLALLAFQAAGHYYFNGEKYSDHVALGLQWLIEDQAPDGSIVGSQNPPPQAIAAGDATFQQYFMYEHAIATFALCEACAVAIAEGRKPDPGYLAAAMRAVLFIERLQHSDGGWRYTTNPNDASDCSVSGWVMLALKTAGEAKIKILPPTIFRMMAFFWAHHVAARTYYFSPTQQGTDAMTGVGMMAAEFFPSRFGKSLVADGANYLADKAGAGHGRGALPATDYYLWYNCTMAMFQVGGQPWQNWNEAIRDHVIALQVHGANCDRGSWPPNDQWSSRGGRIYSTALAVLTLEVYYRFQRLHNQGAEKK